MTAHSQSVSAGGAADAATVDGENSADDSDGAIRPRSALLGGILLAFALTRRSIVGTAAAIAGVLLLYRGIRGGAAGSDERDAIGPESDAAGSADGPTTVEQSITVGAPPEELAEYWRDPERLSQVLGHFAAVESVDEDRQRWTVRGPRDWSSSWEVRMVEEEPDRLLRWETADGSAPVTGSVHFREAPTDRGTEVTLSLAFDPPGGAVGTALVERLGIVPKTVATKALHRFKSLVETGEIQTLERNPSGRGQGDLV